MPDSIRKEFHRALEFHKVGHLDNAEDAYLTLLIKQPYHSSALHNMGVILAQKHKQQEAIGYFDRAIVALPDYAEAFNNKGSALLALGKIDQAVASYKQSLKIRPDYWEAELNLANTLMKMNEQRKALDVYAKLLKIDPHNYSATFNAGLANLALGKLDNAQQCFFKTMIMRQSEQHPIFDQKYYCYTTKAKLLHDVEQFRYLSKIGSNEIDFDTIADKYEKLISEINWKKTSRSIVELTEKEQLRIAESYNRSLHISNLPKFYNGVVNPLLETKRISQQYNKSTPNLAYFDHFLTKDALINLRKFMLGSTIWYDFFHIDGQLAAYLENGLANPLLYKIAHDIKTLLPEIFGSLPLTQVWAFKNLYGNQGIDLHADSGAVSLNFWITPDEANLGTGQGGLLINETPPPQNWKLNNYYKDAKLIEEYLYKTGGKTQSIPYRENRAVIFKSELFHKSDVVNFKSGYKNNRINITMIFGYGDLNLF